MSRTEKRVKALQNLGIIALLLVSIKYANDLFGTQIDTLFIAINAIVFPLGVALFISYLLAPIVKLLDKKIKKRWISVVLVFILLLVIVALFILLVGTMIYDQAQVFVLYDWESILASIENFTENNSRFAEIYESISGYISVDSVSAVTINIFNLFKSFISILLSIVLVPVFLFFILNDKEKIFEGLLVVVPKKYKKDLRELGIRSNVVIEKYFNGRFTSMFIMSIFFTIIFFILGLRERSVFFGFTLGFLDIIPYIGGFIGMLLPLLYSFTVPGELMFGEWTFIAIIITNIVGQGLQGGIIQPWIMGREVSIHPLLVLSSFIFFGSLFGVTGIILAIPITGIIKVTFDYFIELKENSKKIEIIESIKSPK